VWLELFAYRKGATQPLADRGPKRLAGFSTPFLSGRRRPLARLRFQGTGDPGDGRSSIAMPR